MPEAHALLSPSSAHRWMACPASVDMASRVESISGESGSDYAREGTDAHTIAYIEAAFHFGLIDEPEWKARSASWAERTPVDEQADMLRYADLYVQMLAEIIAEMPGATVLLEQRVDTGVPHCWGTGDAIIISGEAMHVVDYKYGKGISVYAEDNPQLRLYAVGALDTFDLIGEISSVCMSIFQPRIGLRSQACMSAVDLRAWRDDVVIPLAAEAMGDHPRFGPSDEACRFCPAAGECKPRLLHVTRRDFGDPDLLTPEEIAEALSQLPSIRDWCNAIEELALTKAYSEGVILPGYKVVLSGGKRSIPDVEAAVQVLVDAGYLPEQVVRVGIRPFYELESTVGKKELTEILGDLIVTSKGKPSLVPEGDKRPAISPEVEAKRDFQP